MTVPSCFSDEANDDSVKVLRHLELIDDEAAQFGVRMVKIDDPLMAKKYGHRIPPGLGYFRKGNYIKFDGEEDGQLSVMVCFSRLAPEWPDWFF